MSEMAETASACQPLAAPRLETYPVVKPWPVVQASGDSMPRDELGRFDIRLLDIGVAAPPIHRHVDGLDVLGAELRHRLMHMGIGKIVEVLPEIIPHDFLLPLMREHVEREEDASIGMRCILHDG